MYIEVLHDSSGAISHCYCADTLPSDHSAALFRIEGGMPSGVGHCRINIDTIGAMEIEGTCGLQAAIDPLTQKPLVVDVDRADYIMRSFMVDVTDTVALPPAVKMPAGVSMRRLKRI